MQHAPPSGGHRAGRRRRARGLTLVEFALVLALLGILTALATTAWGAWRDRVHTQTAQADLIAFSLAIDDHLAHHGQLPPDLAAVGRGRARDPWGNAYV